MVDAAGGVVVGVVILFVVFVVYFAAFFCFLFFLVVRVDITHLLVCFLKREAVEVVPAQLSTYVTT